MIPPVVASDRGRAQTGVVAMRRRGCRTTSWHGRGEWNGLESPTRDGDSPVHEARVSLVVS